MKLTRDFEAVPNGEIYPRVLSAGEDCPPELEAHAIALGVVDADEAAKKAAEEAAAKAAVDEESAKRAAEGKK